MDKIICEDEYYLNLKDGTKLKTRTLQLEILTIMDEIHRVCMKNDIPYCLIAGSALGIVNYKGFIPWDDDMDICVLREDYDRFVEALKKDLSDEFYFHCYETDKRYNILIPSMKIRKRGTCIEEVNFLLKNRCDGDGIFIDVVIYDHVSDSTLVDQIFRTIPKLLMPFYVLFDNLHIQPYPLKKIILWVSEFYAKLNKNSNSMSQTIAIPWEKFLKEPIFDKDDVLPFSPYEFEGRTFYSYHNIEKVVHKWYGPNCTKRWNGTCYEETLPKEKRKSKHSALISLTSDSLD